jgi:signal transduction histidine kinase/ActR/RegA family two-component response regulator
MITVKISLKLKIIIPVIAVLVLFIVSLIYFVSIHTSDNLNAEVAFFVGEENISTTMLTSNDNHAVEYIIPDELVHAIMENEAIGKLFIGFSNEPTTIAADSLRLAVVIIGAISLLITVALILFILVRFLNPLGILTKNIMQISGEYTENVTIYGGSRNDEIGDLSRSIQHMWNEFKAMAKKIETALEQAHSASKSKSRFLSHMSHEIRTPMNAITGMVSIGKSADNVEKKHYALEKIESVSAHLLNVISDVLDMSKIEADKFELSSVEFNFAQVVNKVVDVICFPINENNQSIKVNLDSKIPEYVIGDDQRLMQVINNLLSNAVKFSSKNGKIELEASLIREEGRVCIIQINIIDSGIGISIEQQERIFDSFEQAEINTSRYYGGTGLGLAISKQIVRLMGGDIWVESVFGQGSTFSFTVALTRSDCIENAETEAIDIASDVSFEGFHILLAEDVEINREIVISILEDTYIEIDCAVNGKEAVEMVKQNPGKYDLIFMDVQMPEMDGFEATKQIRALEAETYKKVPIVAMTASVFKEEIQQCLEAGMDDHIGKPIDYTILIKLLMKYLTK